MTPADAGCCRARHRTWAAVARCRYGRGEQYRGEGPWAFVHLFTAAYWTAPRLHITLFPDRAAAEAAAAAVAVPCSGTCTSHRVEHLAGRAAR